MGSLCRYKQLQLDAQSSLASLQRTKDHIEEFTAIKQQCDQVIVRLSTDVLKVKSKSADGAMEAIESALTDLSQVKAQADDLLNAIVAMETLVNHFTTQHSRYEESSALTLSYWSRFSGSSYRRCWRFDVVRV